MKKCKYCQAEMADDLAVCPACGAEVPKVTPAKIALAVAAVVVLAAVLIALLVGGMNNKAEGGTVASEPSETATVTEAATEAPTEATVPADGNPDDETCKGSYTASDEEVIANADTVVATAGEFELTNAELQIYYWLEVQSFLGNYGSYAYYFGLDYTQPLDTQVCSLAESGTWQQFFLASALQSWQNYQAMAAEADANGFVLSAEDQEYLTNLPQSLEEDAVVYGFADAQEMLAYNVGNGAELEDYIHFMEVYYKGYQYYGERCEQFEITDEAVEEYYLANEAEYTESGITQDQKYVDVRHILIMPEGGTTDDSGATTYSDEEWEACRAEAQAILDQWLAGDKTEESFAELANQYTADGNDANYDGVPDGGLYTDVVMGQMVEPFENWCFDESRVVGDTDLVQTVYGYHVMYFVDSTPIWKVTAESDMVGEMATNMIKEIIDKHPLSVDYSSILLSHVDMNA